MATIICNGTHKKEVPDGSSLMQPCIDMKIPVARGCYKGICGGCKALVTAGRENIEDLSGAPYLAENEILLCQSRILTGDVTIEYSP